MLFGTLGLISLNHNQGTIASNIEVGYPYIIAFLMMISVIVGIITGSNLIPRSGPKIEKPTGLNLCYE